MLTARKIRSDQALRRTQGFTLAEVMIGAAIAVIALLGLLGTTILSYKYALAARYKERATSALMSIADQFQNSPVIDHSQTTATTYPTKYKVLFHTTSSRTGLGMAWDGKNQTFIYPTSNPPSPADYTEGNDDLTGLTVPLNTVSDTVDSAYYARITRTVAAYNDLYPESGVSLVNPDEQDGCPGMLVLELIAEYPYDAHGNKVTSFLGDQEVSIKVLRTITKTDKLQ